MKDIFLDNRYTDLYFRIIKRRRAKPFPGYTESHHVVPESFFVIRKRKGPPGWLPGNSEDPSNKINLKAKEHFICHWLLTMMTTGVARQKCLIALKGMKAASKKHQRYHGKITASVYAALKEDIARAQSEAMMGKNPMYGTTWSEERKQAFVEAISGDNNPAKRPGVGKLIGDSKRGVARGEFGPEWIANLCKANAGEGNGMYGKSHRDSTKELLKERAEQMAWVNNGNMSKRVNKIEVQDYLVRGWSRGRHYVSRGPRGPYKKKQPT